MFLWPWVGVFRARGRGGMARGALAPASGNTRTKREAASKAEAAMKEPDVGSDEDEPRKIMSVDEYEAWREAKKKKEEAERSSTLQRCSRGGKS